MQLTRDYSDSQYMSVSDLMIAQFFHHVVENDEAWDLSEDSDDDPLFLDWKEYPYLIDLYPDNPR